MIPQIYKLKNNIRLVYQPAVNSRVSHLALMVHAGTRNEKPGKEGLAHFIEHVFFKGTEKRKSFHILNRLDSVGGELNAFTSKEETCLYASVMNQHTERACELLSDIFFNSVFPEKELEKEKKVIIDEIRTYEDTPSEQILDDFEGQVFSRHGLGNPVLGTIESVNSIGRSDIFEFIQSNYAEGKIVLSVVSDLSFVEIKKLAERYFSINRKAAHKQHKSNFKNYRQADKTIIKPISQCHAVVGNIAYSYRHPMRFTFALLNNILGGPGMNSRLNLNIREKYGFTYQVESNYTPYSDTGIFYIYFATDRRNVDRTVTLVHRELARLKDNRINEIQLKHYKEQLIGQLAMSYENKAGLALSAAKNLLCFDKIDTPEQVNKYIETVTSRQLREAANEIFETGSLSSLFFHPAA